MPSISIKPGRVWYAVAALLLLAGILVLPLAIIVPILTMPRSEQFMVPGVKAFQIAAPGKYVLWHDTQAIFQGRTFVGKELPDGLLIQLSNTSAATVVPLTPDRTTTMNTGDTSRRSIATFAVTAPGPHVLSVEGKSPPMVFSFSRSAMGNFVWSIGLAAVLCPSLLLLGLVLGICVFVKRRNGLNKAAGI